MNCEVEDKVMMNREVVAYIAVKMSFRIAT